MKDYELKVLLREIVRGVLKEYSSMMSSSDQEATTNADPNADPTAPPEEAMTAAEKAKMERDKRVQQQKDVKQKTVELDAEKKQSQFYQRQVDQSKRFGIPSKTKELQKLKGAQI